MVIDSKYYLSKLDIASEREVEGDLLLGDMGQVSTILFSFLFVISSRWLSDQYIIYGQG